MRMFDIIARKRDGGVLSKNELSYFIDGLVRGEIPDYQTAALLMAMYINGLNKTEMTDLTMLMAYSGETCDLSEISGIKVDKHSTGGVGDKTTLVVAPIIASLGIPVAKMSGRGLGHTGGTIDKLESIKGFQTRIPVPEMIKNVKKSNISIVGQSNDLCPADKKLYALRDVTATISSIPLLASSIMSKKIASGADGILLDVKVGSGAFLKNIDDALKLATAMIDIAKTANRKAIALISDMSQPLGNAVGNAVEVMEACAVLNDSGPYDLMSVCVELASAMMELGDPSKTGCQVKQNVFRKLEDGQAFSKFLELIQNQGGQFNADGTIAFKEGGGKNDCFFAAKGGYIETIDAELVGKAALILGAGREKKEDAIDYRAGILFSKKVGDEIGKGEPIAVLEAENTEKIALCKKTLESAITISDAKPKVLDRHILGKITQDKQIIF